MKPLCMLAILAVFVAQSVGQDFVDGHLKGRVTDSNGKPVAGASVIFNRATGTRMDLSKLRETKTDDAGDYDLVLRFDPAAPLIVYEVFVELPGYFRAAHEMQVSITADEPGKQDFVLQPGEVFAGELRIPLSPAEIARKTKPAELRRFFRVVGPALEKQPLNAQFYQTEPGGKFKIYLPPGEYGVEIGPLTSNEPFTWEHLKTGRTDLVLELTPFEWSEEEVGKAFDGLWEAMDRSYSYFFLKDVDWKAIKEQYRPKAVAAKNAEQLAEVLQGMLAPLRDLHVWIATPRGRVSPSRSSYNYNGNLRKVVSQLEEKTECDKFALVGKTKEDGFGYFLMLNQGAATPVLVKKAAAAIRKLSAAPGFVVDLRRANGGSEPLAAEIASLFCAKDTVYAKSKFRNGPGHDEFTQEYERVLPASENAYTRRVVCLIGPGAVSSGEGFVKMMQCLPHVTTVGLRTRGASGNPSPFPVARTGLVVYFSRWVDMLPDGQTFEGVGIAPEVEINDAVNVYAKADPTLDQALELLRQKVANKPGAR